jgi:hypothetical protein
MNEQVEAGDRASRGMGLILVIAVTAALVGGRAGWALRGDPEPEVRVRKVKVGVTPASCLAALEVADRLFGVASEVVGSIDPAEPRSADRALRVLRGTVRAIRGPWAQTSTDCKEA